MTATAPPPAAPPRVPPAPAEPAIAAAPPAPRAGGGERARGVEPARVAAVAALCVFAAAHWGVLLAEPPGGRLSLVALLAAVAGAISGLAGALPVPAPLARAASRLPARRALGALWRLALAAAALALGLLLAGLEARLLAPGGWAELGVVLDDGLGALRSADFPYGGDEWSELAIALGLPALIVPGAVLACWPGRRAAVVLRTLGAALLVGAYATAVTNVDVDGEMARGALLAALLAVWLAPPPLRGRDARVGAAVVVAASLAALPVAAALDADRPWFDYKRWNWFGAADGTAFDWNHVYGPIDWPRDGRTLLEVGSRRPLYWKVQTLDRFDGFVWGHSRVGDDTASSAELPPRLDRRWIVDGIRFRVRELRTTLIPVAGTALAIRGAGPSHTTGDGTTFALGDALREGVEYTVDAYVPDPDAAQMRGAGDLWPESVRRYLRLELPRPGESAIDGTGRAGDAARSVERPQLSVPFRGEPDGGAARRQLAASAYGRTQRLALRLAQGEPTAYDVVKRIERHLRSGRYSYTERPPSHDVPLESFLFEDRAGYCQHFSGAMALMLRMNGIPARVVGGFSPGSYNRDRRTYRVRDLDAHSWVEVYFRGIGWVPFDPTPQGTPAASRAAPERAASATGETDPGRGGVAAERAEAPAGGAAAAGEDEDDRLPAWAVPLALLLAALAAGGVVSLRTRLAERDPRAAAERRVAELLRALRRLGWPLAPGTTLLELEQRLARAAGPAAAAYARALRDHRYARAACAPPGAAERRALRRDLARRGGLRWRLRCLLALPPWQRRRRAPV